MAEAKPELVDARTAMEMLGVKAQTLYAYVSRGLLRSVNPGARKSSLYHREDVEALQMRGRVGRTNDNQSQRAIRVGGGAVLQTTITALTERGPAYRGHLATVLASTGRTFEQCAELLWSGLLPARSPAWQPPEIDARFEEVMKCVRPAASRMSSRRMMSLGVEVWAACAGSDAETAAAAPILAAREVIHVMTGCAGLLRPRPVFTPTKAGERIAMALGRSLGMAQRDEQLEILDAALVLCADHELAPATFAARIAASAGADIYSCISSALGTFEGPFTGLGCDLAERALRDAASTQGYIASLSRLAKQKQPLPGFNHPVYPHGDPRAVMLLERVAALKRKPVAAVEALRAIEAGARQLKSPPGITSALGVVAIALELPAGSGAAIMALGRTPGWIAHVYEQRTAGFLVRPRAKYVGLGGAADAA